MKCAPVCSLPPFPLFFSFFHTFGLWFGRLEARRSEPWAQPLTGRRASTASVRPAREGGHFLLLPLSICNLTACLEGLQNDSGGCSQSRWTQPLAPGCPRSRLREAQTSMGLWQWPRPRQTLPFMQLTRVPAPGRSGSLP